MHARGQLDPRPFYEVNKGLEDEPRTRMGRAPKKMAGFGLTQLRSAHDHKIWFNRINGCRLHRSSSNLNSVKRKPDFRMADAARVRSARTCRFRRNLVTPGSSCGCHRFDACPDGGASRTTAVTRGDLVGVGGAICETIASRSPCSSPHHPALPLAASPGWTCMPTPRRLQRAGCRDAGARRQHRWERSANSNAAIGTSGRACRAHPPDN